MGELVEGLLLVKEYYHKPIDFERSLFFIGKVFDLE